MPVRIGELLLKEKRITADQLQQALNHQKAGGGKLGYNLVKMGFVKDEEITALLSKQYGVPSINLAQFEIDPGVVKLIPPDTAHKYQIVPLSRSGATLTIAMTDPDQRLRDGRHQVHDRLQRGAGRRVGDGGHRSDSEVLPDGRRAARPAAPRLRRSSRRPARAPSRWPARASRSCRRRSTNAGEVEVLEELQEISADALAKQGEDAPVVRLVNVVLMSAIQKGASDIHIEPYEKELRVRYRIDGILYNIMSPPMKFRDAIVSRIKIMSKLDIAEKRLPQDGRIKIRFNESGTPKEIDFRVSVLPTLFGEKIVMRLLDKDKLMLDMTKLGFEPESLAKFEAAILRPWGMVLVTGPTGSGKTNTLYSAISKINTPETNIMTAEDPVEFNLVGVNQVQVQGEHRPELRRGAAVVSAAGPQHHPGRRNPRLRDRGNRGQGGAHRPSRALDAAHQRRAEHGQPPHEHGHRAVPRRELGASDLRPASRAPGLLELQGAGAAAAAGARAGGLHAGGRRHGQADEGQGLRACNQTGYKGRVGLYEVMEIARGAARADSRRRLGPRAAAQGGRRRNDHAAAERPAQGEGRDDDDRRSRAGDGEIGAAAVGPD